MHKICIKNYILYSQADSTGVQNTSNAVYFMQLTLSSVAEVKTRFSTAQQLKVTPSPHPLPPPHPHAVGAVQGRAVMTLW